MYLAEKERERERERAEQSRAEQISELLVVVLMQGNTVDVQWTST